MADARGIRAGKAFVELMTDDRKLSAGLKMAAGKLKAWGAGIAQIGAKMMGLGAAIVTPLAAMTLAAAKGGSQLYDLSRRTGMGVEALSSLSYAAQMSCNDMETLELAIYRMQKSVAGVEDAAEGTTGKLDKLGLTAKDVSGLKVDEQFSLIARRIAAIPDPTERAAAAMTVFGRSGAKLIPIFEDFQRYGDQAKAFGFVKDANFAAGAKAAENAFKFLRISVGEVGESIAGALMPILRDVMTQAGKIALGLRKWIDENHELVVTVLKWGAGLLVAGAGLVVVGKALALVGATLSGVMTVASGIGSILSTLGVVIGGLLSPLGLVLGAVAALGAYFLISSGSGGKALAWLGDRFTDLRTDAVSAFGGISDALAAGDIALAGKVLWLTLKMWWEKGTGWISDIWNGGLLWVKQRFFEVWGGLQIIFSAVGHGMSVAWIETTSFLSQTWSRFVTALVEAWNWCGNMLQQAWNRIKGVFDSSFDAGAANKAAGDAYQSKQKELEDNKNFQLAERERRRQQERDAESRDFNDQLGRIIDETEAAKRGAEDERNAKLKANQEAIAAARQEWSDALSEAAKKRQATDAARGAAGKLESPDELLERLKKNSGPMQDGLQAAKMTVMGTFNTSALRGLAATGPADRIAKATEATATNTAKLLEKDFGDNVAFA